MATTATDMPKNEIEPMVTAAAIAKLLGVSSNWVRTEARLGNLPAYRLGRSVWRFRVSEVLAWAERNGPADADA